MVSPVYLLDTNTWIYALKGQPESIVSKLGTVDPTTVVFCSVVKAELLYGARRHSTPQKRLDLLNGLFQHHRSYDFDDRSAGVYSHIRRELEVAGRPIGPMDMLIAAIAIANDLTLVTHNFAEFERVPELRVVDWIS
jgi:tRNA(fMet)-specific endonuclease VapC